MSSNFEDAVERAFDRTIEDFNRASKEASAIFWNEDTLRMTFFRYLCEQDIKIKRFFSEFEISLWGRKYRPDLVVHIESGNELVMSAFEFKFYSGGWQRDWEKIRTYLKEGFTYGYFVAIGTKSLANELTSKRETINSNYAQALIYTKPLKEAFGYAPSFRIAENLLKKTLDMPYTISIPLMLAATIPEDYALIYQYQPDKCLLLATFPDEGKWNRIEEELKKVGLVRFLQLKEDKWDFETTDKFRGIALLAELPPNSYNSTALKAKKALNTFASIIAFLKPTLNMK